MLKYTRETAGRGGRKKSPTQAAGGNNVDCVHATAGLHAAYVRPLFNCGKQKRHVGNVAARPAYIACTLEGGRNKL